MITIFNRKKLYVDISEVECLKVKDILTSAGIKFKEKKIQSASALANYSRRTMANTSNDYVASINKSKGLIIRYIYVARKDYAKAKKIIY